MSEYFKTELVTIPAGAREIKLPIAGEILRYISGRSALNFRFWGPSGKSEEIEMFPGYARLYKDGRGFIQVSVSRSADDAADAPAVFRIGYGTGYVEDGRAVIDLSNPGGVPVSESPAKGIGRALPGGVLAGLSSLELDGKPPAGCFMRKAVIVSNDDPSNKLTILDESGVPIVRIYPFTSVRLDAVGAVSVRNDAGSAVACAVSEIWYLS